LSISDWVGIRLALGTGFDTVFEIVLVAIVVVVEKEKPDDRALFFASGSTAGGAEDEEDGEESSSRGRLFEGAAGAVSSVKAVVSASAISLKKSPKSSSAMLRKEGRKWSDVLRYESVVWVRGITVYKEGGDWVGAVWEGVGYGRVRCWLAWGLGRQGGRSERDDAIVAFNRRKWRRRALRGGTGCWTGCVEVATEACRVMGIGSNLK
jgi:hypothetical protein